MRTPQGMSEGSMASVHPLDLDARRDRVDVLGGVERDREALAFHALPPSAPVILVEKDLGGARTHGRPPPASRRAP